MRRRFRNALMGSGAAHWSAGLSPCRSRGCSRMDESKFALAVASGSASQLFVLATLCVVVDADLEFSTVYAREGERVLLFVARRTLDVEVAGDLTAETFAIAFGS